MRPDSAQARSSGRWTTRRVLAEAMCGNRRRRTLVGAALLLMGHQVGEAAVPVLIGGIIDSAIEPTNGDALAIGIGILAVVFTVFSLSFRFGARLLTRFTQSAEHAIRMLVVRRELDPRGIAGSGRSAGELMSIATADAARVAELGRGIAMAAAGSAAFVVAAITLLSVSWVLGLLVLLGTPPLVVLMSKLGAPLERRSGVEQEQSARAGAMAADLIGGLRVLKGIGAETAAVTRYRTSSRSSLGATLRAARALAVYQGLMVLLSGGFLVVVALVAGRQAVAGQITVGDLIAAVGLAQFLQGPLRRIGLFGIALAHARGSAERVADVLDAPAAVCGGTAGLPAELRGELSLAKVSSGPLREVSFTVAAGELLGVACSDGAAAVELLATIGRVVDPADGAVLVDKVALRKIDPELLRSAVVVVRHDAVLFDGTLQDNVAAAAHGLGAVESAMRAAAVDEVAASLGADVQRLLGEKGRALSGGQRQRVSLARALATNAPVLVLHDPTTAVDSVTEARIATGVAALRRGRTTVLVTTSPALLAVCDRVVFLDDGVVAAVGTHLELSDTQTDYRSAVLS